MLKKTLQVAKLTRGQNGGNGKMFLGSVSTSNRAIFYTSETELQGLCN